MLFLPDRMAGSKYGLQSVYEKIDMAPDDFADLAEKLMGGNINDPE